MFSLSGEVLMCGTAMSNSVRVIICVIYLLYMKEHVVRRVTRDETTPEPARDCECAEAHPYIDG
jgi:hypothetical protein